MTTFLPSFPAHLAALVTVVVLAVAGCSGGVKKVTVRGTIAHKGQPLQSGILQFVGPEGAYSAAVIQLDGTFIITDVAPGDVKVGVMEAPSGSRSPTPPVSLPEKYRDPEKSGVKYTITPATTELRIDLP